MAGRLRRLARRVAAAGGAVVPASLAARLLDVATRNVADVAEAVGLSVTREAEPVRVETLVSVPPPRVSPLVQPVRSVTRAQPVGSVTRAQPVGSVTRAQPVGSVTRAQPVRSVTRAQPVRSVTRAHPVRRAEPVTIRAQQAAPKPKTPDTALLLARHLSLSVERRRRAVFHADPFNRTAGTHDAQAVRAMRLGSRRLRALVEVYGPWMGKKLARRLRGNLREITRALGPLRELDALVATLEREAAAAVEPAEAVAIEHLLETIDADRAQARRQAAKQIRRVDRKRLQRDLDEAIPRIMSRLLRLKPDGVQAPIWSLLSPRVDWAFEAALPTDLADEPRVHEARVRCKRLRYGIELVEPALDDANRDVRRFLKRTQGAIGNARDVRQAARRAEEQRAVLLSRGRTTLAAAMTPVCLRLAHQATLAEARILPALRALEAEALPERCARALGCAATYRYPLPSQVGQ